MLHQLVCILRTRDIDVYKRQELDLSDRTKEFEKKMFPLNIMLNFSEVQNWQNQYYAYCNYNPEAIKEFTRCV